MKIFIMWFLSFNILILITCKWEAPWESASAEGLPLCTVIKWKWNDNDDRGDEDDFNVDDYGDGDDFNDDGKDCEVIISLLTLIAVIPDCVEKATVSWCRGVVDKGADAKLVVISHPVP